MSPKDQLSLAEGLQPVWDPAAGLGPPPVTSALPRGPSSLGSASLPIALQTGPLAVESKLSSALCATLGTMKRQEAYKETGGCVCSGWKLAPEMLHH